MAVITAKTMVMIVNDAPGNARCGSSAATCLAVQRHSASRRANKIILRWKEMEANEKSLLMKTRSQWMKIEATHPETPRLSNAHCLTEVRPYRDPSTQIKSSVWASFWLLRVVHLGQVISPPQLGCVVVRTVEVTSSDYCLLLPLCDHTVDPSVTKQRRSLTPPLKGDVRWYFQVLRLVHCSCAPPQNLQRCIVELRLLD